MSKYIIEVPVDAQYIMINGVRMGDCYTQTTYIEDIEELNSDYINEHYGNLQDEAYQRGLDDAWEAARKIAEMWETIDDDDLLEIFGVTARIGESTFRALFKKQTASEAIEKLKAYEEKQKADDEIKVGDEVIYNGTTKCIVVRPEDDERYASLIDSDGIHYSADHRECKKTCRHFDIQKILEAMKA